MHRPCDMFVNKLRDLIEQSLVFDQGTQFTIEKKMTVIVREKTTRMVVLGTVQMYASSSKMFVCC